MSVSSVIPPFNLLLNSISHDLNPQNLQSLIHICERYIPESKREEIKNGIDVFRILKQQNVIGDDHEKVQHLEEIVRAMRPKRKDIVKKVRDFIRDNYDPGYDFESSGEFPVFRTCESPPAVLVPNHHRQPPPLDRYNSSGSQRDPSVEVTSSTENHCSMDCCCWGCNCYARQIPSCVLLILTGIMAILTFLSILLWFGKIPENLHKKLGPDGSKAGGYVVGSFGAATIAFLCWWIYRKLRGNRHEGQIPYQHFTNDVSSPVAVDNQTDACSTLAQKGSTTTPTSVRLPIKKQKRRPHGTMTADSSLDTAASASVLEREQQQRHYPAKRAPRAHRKSTTDDGGLQTDGACGSAETDEFQSKESLFFDSSNDYDIDESTAVPPMTAE